MERANQTRQDRLVKELRLRGIDDMEVADAFLPEFMLDDNQRFSVAATSDEDAHRAVNHSARELDLLLSEPHERTLSKNLSLQYRNTTYQLQHSGPGYRLRGAKVTLCELGSGEIVLLYEGRELPFAISRQGERPPAVEDEKTLNDRVDAALAKQPGKGPPKPAADHPWRQAGAIAAARSATPLAS